MQLVVTEKPSVAQAISHVIGAKERKDGYMEGNGFLVSWCVGHLVELAQPEMYSEAWKKWSYESLPMIPEQWQHEVKWVTGGQATSGIQVWPGASVERVYMNRQAAGNQ